MTTYISILRGINVSGQKLIKMEALRKMYENLGFANVKSYVQSGNVIFTTKKIELKKLSTILSQQIEKDFGFEVPVIVLHSDKLNQIILNNPFLKLANKDHSFLHTTFLSTKPEPYNLKIIEDKKQNNEELFFTDDTIYLYCPNGYGKTKLSNNFIENKLKVVATTRNWKTTNELLKLANQTI